MEPVIARVLVAGSASQDAIASGRVAPKKGKPARDSKGNLAGPIVDVAKMEEALRRKDRDIGLRLSASSSSFKALGTQTPKGSVYAALEKAMRDESAPWVELYYSGHGTVLAGDWCFEDAGGKVTEYIEFEDIVRLWLAACRSCPQKTRLFINCDCCYSGAWVKKAERLGDRSIVVRASCGHLELSWDTPSGGVFTKAVLKLMQENASRERFYELYSGRALLGTDEPQTPCMYKP